jgi:hypothetical protein
LIRETANYFQAQATLDAAVAASEFFREDLMEDSFACAMWGKGADGMPPQLTEASISFK